MFFGCLTSCCLIFIPPVDALLPSQSTNHRWSSHPLHAHQIHSALQSVRSPPAGQVIDGACDTASDRVLLLLLPFLGMRGGVGACIVERVHGTTVTSTVITIPSDTSVVWIT